MVRIAFSPCRFPPSRAGHEETFYRAADTGKKLPFVNSEELFLTRERAKKFLVFNNRNF
jgi:hypothetical protein